MASSSSFCVIILNALLVAKGQQPTGPAYASTPITNPLIPTPQPTHMMYPCDYVDPATNTSNCGACVANNSCIWCISDQSCHVKKGYDEDQCVDPKSGDAADVITGSGHLYECCESSSSCGQCTTLEYVLCDWCIPTKQCFNASETTACHDGEDGDYGKHIVFKDGVCRDEDNASIWEKLKHYYLQIPFLFRCILDTLLSLCFILLAICCCLCVKNKVHKRRLRKKYKNMKVNSSRDYLRFKEKN